MALLPINERETEIINYDNRYRVTLSAKDVADIICKQNNSSLLGRIEASKYLISDKYKLPFIYNEKDNKIIFYTRNLKSNNCHFFVLDSIYNYKKVDDGVEITLINNEKIIIKESYNIFQEQYFKAIKLEKVLNNRNRSFSL